MVARTESEFLASLRNACIARTGVSRFAHAAICDCAQRPACCVVCDRSFEEPESLSFSASLQGFACVDCEINAAESANERATDRYYGASTPQTNNERLSVEGRE